jgi:hypothetical protein
MREVTSMTDREWLEGQELELEEAAAALTKERRLEACRRQKVITQAQLSKIGEEREWLEQYRERKEELWADGLADYQEELAWDEAKLKAALEGGAEVEAGELTLADALPRERQLKLAY